MTAPSWSSRSADPAGSTSSRRGRTASSSTERDFSTASRSPRDQPIQDARIAALRRSLSWFWHELGHFITAANRGQLCWAAGQLEALRGHAVNLARIEQGADVDDEPYWKLDTTVTPEALEPLRATFVPIERTALVAAARSVVEDVDRRGRKLAADLGVAYPDDLAALTTRRLAAL